MNLKLLIAGNSFLVVAIIACVLLAGCVSSPAQAQDTTQAAQSLAQVTAADLDAAIAIANANNDADGAACWTAMKAWLGAPKSAAPAVAGVFSAFEALRGKVSTLQAGVPHAVHVACSPLIVDANTLLLRFGAIAASPIK